MNGATGELSLSSENCPQFRSTIPKASVYKLHKYWKESNHGCDALSTVLANATLLHMYCTCVHYMYACTRPDPESNFWREAKKPGANFKNLIHCCNFTNAAVFAHVAWQLMIDRTSGLWDLQVHCSIQDFILKSQFKAHLSMFESLVHHKICLYPITTVYQFLSQKADQICM